MESQSQERLKNQLLNLRKVLTEDGPFKPSSTIERFQLQVGFILEILDEVDRLQAIEAERDRYKSALLDILECYDIPTAVQEIAKNNLEGVNDHEK